MEFAFDELLDWDGSVDAVACEGVCQKAVSVLMWERLVAG